MFTTVFATGEMKNVGSAGMFPHLFLLDWQLWSTKRKSLKRGGMMTETRTENEGSHEILIISWRS
jgi:hypothetical protein